MENQITPNPSVPSQVVQEVKFPKFVNNLGIIPTSYKDSMSYYECLAWLCKYLEETVIPTVNENGEAVEELQGLYVELKNYILEAQSEYENEMNEKFETLKNYVNNYFDNLNIQQEINNKLESMLDNGDFDSLISALIKNAKIYTSVDSLKLDNSIVNGQYVRTLEFHENSKVGGALYYISNAELTDNEIDIISVENELHAILIDLDNIYDINKYGADNTGTTDSSSIFNYVFQLINSDWLLNRSYKSTISINGTYLISNTLTMPTCARLTNDRYSYILSNVTNAPTIKIDYINNEITSIDRLDYNWLYADLIDFKNGCFIKNIGNKANTTCIEIGHDSNSSKVLTVARYKLKNISINNFEIAIQKNAYDNYICYYERITFEGNDIGVQLSKNNVLLSNTGENMTFKECLFAHNEYSIKYYGSYSYDLYFQNCSFDFCKNIFYDVNRIGHFKAFINQCHLEGFVHIVNNAGVSSSFIISNSELTFSAQALDDYSSETNFQILYNVPETSNQNSFINLNNNTMYLFLKDEQLFDPEKYIQFGNNIIISGNVSNMGGFLIPRFINKNSIKSFDSLETGDVAYTSATYFNDLKVFGYSNLSTTAKVVQDDYLYSGHKSIELSRSTDSGNADFALISDFIPVKGNIVSISTFVHNMQGQIQCKISYYDNSENLLSESDTYMQQSGLMTSFENKWFMNNTQKMGVIPVNCAFIKVTLFYQNMTNGGAPIGTSVKIGGVIINQN